MTIFFYADGRFKEHPDPPSNALYWEISRVEYPDTIDPISGPNPDDFNIYRDVFERCENGDFHQVKPYVLNTHKVMSIHAREIKRLKGEVTELWRALRDCVFNLVPPDEAYRLLSDKRFSHIKRERDCEP